MKFQTKKHFVVIPLIAIVMVFSLTACSSDFDASRYTKGCLDALTKASFADYVEMTNTTEEQAKADYEKRIETELSTLTATFPMSDEMKTTYSQLFKDIYAKCKYEVGEAVKNDDGSYTVPVTVSQMKIFQDAVADTTAKVEDYVEENPDVAASSTDEIMEIYATYLAEVMRDRVDNAEYADPQSVSISVSPSAEDSNVFSISETDFQKLYNAMLDIDEASDTSATE